DRAGADLEGGGELRIACRLRHDISNPERLRSKRRLECLQQIVERLKIFVCLSAHAPSSLAWVIRGRWVGETGPDHRAPHPGIPSFEAAHPWAAMRWLTFQHVSAHQRQGRDHQGRTLRFYVGDCLRITKIHAVFWVLTLRVKRNRYHAPP